MVGSFLDRLGGFLDRRFIFAYVIPALILLILVIGLLQGLFGLQTTLNWWMHLEGQEQILLGAGTLLAVVLLSSILEMVTAPVVRLYEGYWPEGRLTQIAVARQLKIKRKYRRTAQIQALNDRKKALKAALDAATDEEQKNLINRQIMQIDEQKQVEDQRGYAAFFYTFPTDDDLLKPTRLGNVLVAAEEYSHQVYRLDAVLWWPRLSILLPEMVRVQIDTALTPMLTVLNLSIIFTLSALTGGIIFARDQRWLLCVVILLAGLWLAFMCYLAAINQAEVYGKLVRVAFDLYRHEILRQMHIPVPDNVVDERLMWDLLTQWLYYYQQPWEIPNDVEMPEHSFYYDLHYNPTDSERQQEVVLTFRGFPDLNLKKETKDTV